QTRRRPNTRKIPIFVNATAPGPMVVFGNMIGGNGRCKTGKMGKKEARFCILGNDDDNDGDNGNDDDGDDDGDGDCDNDII
ncbi:unnamed protein product, partial [Onchocerca ochengi]